jgi:hypothetical protein
MAPPKGHPPYPGGGRPLKYTDEFIENEADAFVDWIKKGDNVFYNKFALIRGYHPNRLYEFAKKNEKFAVTLEIAKAWQEAKLVEGGLRDIYNASLTKFMLANLHGWAEKQEVKTNAPNSLSLVLQTIDGQTKDLLPEQ